MFWNKKKTKSKPQIKTTVPKTFKAKEPPPKWQPTFGETKKKDEKPPEVTTKSEPKIDLENKFLKSFQKLTYRHRAWDVWRDYILLLCELMAEVVATDALKKIEQYGYISINDPCCGAGATLIAGVHVIRKQLEHCEPPRNYQNHILVVAQDVDEIVGLMCYIQISLLGLAGFIKIGNSITDPISTDDSSEKYWYTPMYFSDVWSTRRMLRQINKLFGKGDDE